jgi:hypothetical protein
MFSGNRVMILKSKRGIKRCMEQLLSAGARSLGRELRAVVD